MDHANIQGNGIIIWRGFIYFNYLRVAAFFIIAIYKYSIRGLLKVNLLK